MELTIMHYKMWLFKSSPPHPPQRTQVNAKVDNSSSHGFFPFLFFVFASDFSVPEIAADLNYFFHWSDLFIDV
jgi:hypothetical protein